MPFRIHEKACKEQWTINVMRPQEVVPSKLPKDWKGTPMQGLPVEQIPHYKFPILVYLHPNEPFRTVFHRNTSHEVVHEETLPTEHLSKVIACPEHVSAAAEKCEDCEKLLKAALDEGWATKPYIPEKPEDPDGHLYSKKVRK